MYICTGRTGSAALSLSPGADTTLSTRTKQPKSKHAANRLCYAPAAHTSAPARAVRTRLRSHPPLAPPLCPTTPPPASACPRARRFRRREHHGVDGGGDERRRPQGRRPPPSPLERVRNMRMRDVEEEEQRRPRELYTRAKQNMSNRDEPRARDEGSRAGQRVVRWLGAGCRSARDLIGQDGRGLCWGLGAGAVTGPSRGHQAAWAGRLGT